ncbi:LacI family transcriptional regulator [Solihabitans fulvus]|uniref:LacI family transcriptional regulator n=1 Tax=Solihabitans fulvus TaxID=1892852 RepID=A0A5B2WAU0_9PSEU|nr:LacI family DNA-binding transcriptional regulator [Solihabitans fulvus]KAA2248445.1 LacI family transcriptional regulator [Solihabitans fulvus]
MVTMRDVATLAGVSITTVSHVVNGTRAVAPETKTRVLAAIEATGYTGDAIARSLVTGGTKSIGVAISLVTRPYFAELIAAVEDEAAKAGYTLVLVNTRDDAKTEHDAVRTLRSRRVDGLLLTPSAGAGEGVLPELRQLGLPTVLVDRLSVNQELDQVGPENVQATSALVRHLAEAGHRQIAMITGAEGLATTAERVLGYRLGLGRAGLQWDEALVASGEAGLPRLLDVPLLAPTAVVAGDSTVLAGLLRAARARGVRIGTDLAVVGYDEVDWADLVDPPVTTMAQPIDGIGRAAVRMLLARIADPDRPAETVRLPPTLIHRQSCCR